MALKSFSQSDNGGLINGKQIQGDYFGEIII